MIDPELIMKVSRFAGINDEARQLILQKSLVRQYGKGESIFLEGDESAYFYLVLTGEVTVYKILESGREMILGIIQPGEAFGEVAMVDGEEFPANSMARIESSILSLGREDYLQLLKRHPDVALAIIRDLSMRVRQLRTRVEVLGEGGVRSRIAQLLLTFARDLGQETQEGTLVRMPLNRSEVAGMVGARTETVIRIMSQWNKDGAVRTVKDGFLVADMNQLHQAIANEKGE